MESKMKLNKYFKTFVLFIQFGVACIETHRMQVGLCILIVIEYVKSSIHMHNFCKFMDVKNF